MKKILAISTIILLFAFVLNAQIVDEIINERNFPNNRNPSPATPPVHPNPQFPPNGMHPQHTSESTPRSRHYYNRSVIINSALAGLPYADTPAYALTDAQKKDIINTINIRIADYEEALQMMKKTLSTFNGREIDSSKTSESATNEHSNAEDSKKKGESKEMPVNYEGEIVDASKAILIASNKDGGTATAFIAKMKGKLFIITNAHVMLSTSEVSFKTIDGVFITLNNAGFISQNKDIYLIPINEIPAGSIALEIVDNISDEVRIHDEVIVCGNSEGGGVLHRTLGKIQAIGPDNIETNCAIFQGNSGSPIYHKKTQKVVGVISHARVQKSPNNLTQHSMRQDNSPIKSSTRYFGQRIDNLNDLSPLSPTDVITQLNEVITFAKKYAYIRDFSASQYKSLTAGFDYPDYDRIAYAFIKEMRRDNPSKKAIKEFYDQTAKLINNEMFIIKSKKLSPYFKDDVEKIIQVFTKMRDDFNSMAKSPTLR